MEEVKEEHVVYDEGIEDTDEVAVRSEEMSDYAHNYTEVGEEGEKDFTLKETAAYARENSFALKKNVAYGEGNFALKKNVAYGEGNFALKKNAAYGAPH